MGIKLHLTLEEKHRLRMVENKVLRKLTGPKREGVGTPTCQRISLYPALLHNPSLSLFATQAALFRDPQVSTSFSIRLSRTIHVSLSSLLMRPF